MGCKICTTFVETLENGLREYELSERRAEHIEALERLDQVINLSTNLAEKKCRKLYLKRHIVPGEQPKPQVNRPPAGLVFDIECCSVGRHRRKQDQYEKKYLDSGYYILIPKHEEEEGQSANPEDKPEGEKRTSQFV